MKILLGQPYPLGATITPNGINFAVPCNQKIELNFNGQIYPLFQTGEIWHVEILNVFSGDYFYWVNGQKALDPFAKSIDEDLNHCIVVSDEPFNWQSHRPNISWDKTIIYELHIKGFSKLNENIPEALRGTYLGLAHPNSINYLKDLGITAVEILPLAQHIDEPHLKQKKLKNYWGYNTLAPFSVEPSYALKNPRLELKQMIEALHLAGIEVIIDVVFNHTAELDMEQPSYHWRILNNRVYYQNDGGDYYNWSGCGNYLDLRKPIIHTWVIECLRYWAKAFQIDGFRFDLGTVLGREFDFNKEALFLNTLKNDPILKDLKMIVEPWDLGTYQLGQFPDYCYEWNDKYRDNMRKFFLWQSGDLGAFAQYLAGSAGIFQQKSASRSINFLTAHDGFCLNDLVSFNDKNNWANGEENCDGHSENYSYNFGVEGETNHSEILLERLNAQKALFSALLLSNGIPMILAGDEFSHSQKGNNNCYCQDNEITWLNWENLKEKNHQELFQTVKHLIQLRKEIPALQKSAFWTEETVQWYLPNGEKINDEDWQNNQKALQWVLNKHYLLIVNGKMSPQEFIFPTGNWGQKSASLLGLGIQVFKHREQ